MFCLHKQIQVPPGTSKKDVKIILQPDNITLSIVVAKPAAFEEEWDEVSGQTGCCPLSARREPCSMAAWCGLAGP